MPALHLPEDGEAREHVMWGLEPSGCAHGVRREEERQQARLGLDARAWWAVEADLPEEVVHGRVGARWSKKLLGRRRGADCAVF